MTARSCILAALAVLWAFLPPGAMPATAQSAAEVPPPEFGFPARCRIGWDCWYMAYADLTPGAGYTDFLGGVRTYEEHRGTDIAPLDPGASVDVLAAAPGKVIGTRDGLDDTPMRVRAADRDAARCGNGVRIDHGRGWTTQYCHMAKGSIAVKTGDLVPRGTLLGRIGSSGWSELPHLHFQVARGNQLYDPFAGRFVMEEGGNPTVPLAVRPVWSDRANTPDETYESVVVRRVGLTTAVPEKLTAKFDGYPVTAAANPDALVGFAILFGVPAGTRIGIEIRGPDGALIHAGGREAERSVAEFFSFSGKKRGGQDWGPGDYVARFEISGVGPRGEFTIEREATLRLADGETGR
jgi:murein DD-endopeptidase MepM/ murein hydrolase activator NlpD